VVSRVAATAAVVPLESPGDDDPFGFVPRFQWYGPDGPIVRPALDALLAMGAPAAFDYDALAVFLRLGFFVGDDTPFASIRAVPARRPHIRDVP
jgi:hypothetical protein